MNKNNPIIICGSGNSIPFNNAQFYRTGFGFPIKLKQIIKYNYSIGLNYFFKYGCDTTFTSFADWQWYEDNYKRLKELPLLIGCHHAQLIKSEYCKMYENTILLKHGGKYFGKDSWENSFYCTQLVGLFAITTAVALGFKEIYLLGYDGKEINGQTHFYQGVANLKKVTPVYVNDKLKDNRKHFRGVGKKENGSYNTSTYNYPELLNKQWFRPFYDDKSIKIYNVSPDSAITLFKKMSYEQFYQKFKTFKYVDQQQERQEIKDFIKTKQ